MIYIGKKFDCSLGYENSLGSRFRSEFDSRENQNKFVNFNF